jgi:hypothetical protein
VTETDSIQLLRELLRLHDRFGDKAFRDLATSLRDGELVRSLISITDHLPKAAKAPPLKNLKPKSAKVGERERVDRQIEGLISSSLPLDREIGQFMRLIFQGRLLSDMRLLRSFAKEVGLPNDPKRQTRWALMRSLVDYLRHKSQPDLRKYFDLANSVQRDPSNLAGWAKIIVKHD